MIAERRATALLVWVAYQRLAGGAFSPKCSEDGMKRQAYILVMVLLLLGCNRREDIPSASQAAPPQPPAMIVATDESMVATPVVFDISTLKTTANTGALTGVLILKTDAGLKPVTDIKIALGETLSDDDDIERIVAYDPSAAPVSYTNSTGRFRFENLKPGRYGLILDIVLSSFLLFQEGTPNAILFDITAGEVTDLGRLEYSELPLPQSRR